MPALALSLPSPGHHVLSWRFHTLYASTNRHARLKGGSLCVSSIIGGSGHVGTYLVPSLVEAGHEVVNLTRGKRQPYQQHAAWKSVEQVVVDRGRMEADGIFGQRVADLRPDVVIDMICFTLDSAMQLVEALRGRVQHLLSYGTIWVHGPSVQVPTTEEQPRRPFGEYGIQKAAIEAYLLDQTRRYGFPATVVHPGHIVGPGWAPLNPQGISTLASLSRSPAARSWRCPTWAWRRCTTSTPRTWPSFSWRSLANWSTAVGQSFHAVSPGALSLRGYAESVYRLVRPAARVALPAAGSPGRNRSSRSWRKPPGTTSRTAPIAASPRRSVWWATSRATPRCRPSTRR